MASRAREQRAEAVHGLHILTRVALVLAPTCQAEGITLSQYRHLFLIAEEPRRAGALAEAFEVSRPMIAMSIRALEERRWVSRKPVPEDGRGAEIHITRSGRALLNRVETRLLAVLDELAGRAAVDQMLYDALAFQSRLDEATRRESEGGIDPMWTTR